MTDSTEETDWAATICQKCVHYRHRGRWERSHPTVKSMARELGLQHQCQPFKGQILNHITGQLEPLIGDCKNNSGQCKLFKPKIP